MYLVAQQELHQINSIYTLQDTEAIIYNVASNIKELKRGTKSHWKSQIYQKISLIEI